MRRTDVRPICSRRAISDLLTSARRSFRISAVCAAAVAGRPSRLPFSCTAPRLPYLHRNRQAASDGILAQGASLHRKGLLKRERRGQHETFSAASVPGRKRYRILLPESPVLWALDKGRSARPESILF